MYTDADVGRPSFWDVALSVAFFLDADCFVSLSAASLKFDNNPSAADIAVSHSSFSSDVRLCRLHALTVLVNILPIFVFSNMAMVIGCFLLLHSFCSMVRISLARSGVGSAESTMSSRRDLASEANIFSCAVMMLFLVVMNSISFGCADIT